MPILLIGLSGSSAISQSSTLTNQQIAQKILNSRGSNYLTSPSRAYLESVARGDHRLSPDSVPINPASIPTLHSAAPPTLLAAAPVNVRVNNPAEDSHLVDQTTQSETSLTVVGSNVAVGFNDSQNGLLFLTAGADLTGYAYSTDGGATFTDGGTLPNAPGGVNLGDPWLASDGSTMYYSTLRATLNGLFVGVSHSSDGGKTWSPANQIPVPNAPFYQADKDALIAAGPGNLYDTWDDFTFDPVTGNGYSGLPVAHSTDGGATWTITYASKVVNFSQSGGCSFAQYIGAQPLMAGGVLYEAAELISANDPNCTGAPITFSEAIFFSSDGGTTWQAGAVLPITSATQGFGAFNLGLGMAMRALEFPVLTSFKGSVYVAWNDGGDGSGHSHIRLGRLNAYGQFASVAYITSGLNDEVQPAISADTALHVAYYQISTDSNGNGLLDVDVSSSTNGSTFHVQRVTSQHFPGVFNLPQFDPIIAFAYMGDYIATVSDGTHQYFAWGDNRDIVKNFLWPAGRHDPDVFFAKI